MKFIKQALASSVLLLSTSVFGGDGTLPFGDGTLPFGMSGLALESASNSREVPIEVVFQDTVRTGLDIIGTTRRSESAEIPSRSNTLATCDIGYDAFPVVGSLTIKGRDYSLTTVCSIDDNRLGRQRIVMGNSGNQIIRLEGEMKVINVGGSLVESFEGSMTVGRRTYTFTLE
ncbi:MAG: hypothetical protein HRU19_10355 [Pseudobacteriovorax sp.]|nr:hypothetical protein [Pseudobacteriovorax sp.]